jgi:hypothetical protein
LLDSDTVKLLRDDSNGDRLVQLAMALVSERRR